MKPALEQLIWDRAAHCCEYCRLPQHASYLTFQIDHIVARKHGGKTVAANLALACYYCNSYKGPNLSGIDPATGNVIRLFNPRKDRWEQHFNWNGACSSVARRGGGRRSLSWRSTAPKPSHSVRL